MARGPGGQPAPAGGPSKAGAPAPTDAPQAGVAPAAFRPVAATGSSSSPAPGAPAADEGMPGVAGQLIQVLSAPRPVANGNYTVTVALHPESLGTVQATVIAGEQQVAVHLVASTGTGADALRLALPALHEALAASGQQATVSVAAGGPGTGSGTEHSLGQQAAWTSADGHGAQSGQGAQGGPGGQGGRAGGPASGAGPGRAAAGVPGRRGSAGPQATVRPDDARLVDVRV